MAIFPVLYAVSLALIPFFLVWPQIRLNLTTYYLTILFVMHGPSFFVWHSQNGRQPSFHIVSAALLLSLVSFALGRLLMTPSLIPDRSFKSWSDMPMSSEKINGPVLWCTLLIVTAVARGDRRKWLIAGTLSMAGVLAAIALVDVAVLAYGLAFALGFAQIALIQNAMPQRAIHIMDLFV